MAHVGILGGQRLHPTVRAAVSRRQHYPRVHARKVCSSQTATAVAPPLSLNTFSDYMVLHPERATPEDLFRILDNGRIGEISSIDCPRGTVVDDVNWRILIVFSIVFQKILLSVAEPGLSSGILMMNLLVDNHLSKFIWGFFRGKLVMPDKNSVNFRSPFSFIDTREELDTNIKPGDSAYHAHLCIMAAKLSYENMARIRSTVRGYWNMEFLGFYSCWGDIQQSFCTHAFMMSDKPAESGNAELIVVAFRGTDDEYDVCTDIDLSWYEIRGVGKVHGGFMKALGLQKNGWPKEIKESPETPYAYYTIREKLRDVLKKNPKAKLLVTGHSLGGALSALFSIILAYHGEHTILDRLEGVYTFGQPRIGNRQLGEFFEKFLDTPRRRYFRFVYCNDMVCRLPFEDDTFFFKHFGKCLYYNSLYRGKEMDEQPNENYFGWSYFIPQHLNAILELARSFTIEHVGGPDYEESMLMRLIRTMGLIMPGMAAHTPQDYNNITRLGKLIK